MLKHRPMPEDCSAPRLQHLSLVGQDQDCPAEWWLSRPLARTLYHWLQEHDPSRHSLEDGLQALAATIGDGVYAELIFLLTRLRVDPAEARTLWPAVVSRKRDMEARLGHAVDLRTALLSYFVDVERRFEMPKVVEMDWAERTAASALLDEVTGLPNQRFFREQLVREVERSQRENSPLSLLVIDADDFKSVNDRLGHDIGTRTLRGIATQLRRHAREGDLVVRYGGDEFVVVCPSTTKLAAARLAEELRRAVASYVIDGHHGTETLGITVSVGIATCPGDTADASSLFVLADRAAYQAKDAGKNRVVLYGGSSRSYARRRVSWPGHVASVNGHALPVETLEIGEGGLSFVSDGKLDPGTLIEATLERPEGAPVRLAARVAWVRSTCDGRWETAVRFVEHGNPDRERLTAWVRYAAS